MLAWWLQTDNGTTEGEVQAPQSGSDGEGDAQTPAADGADTAGDTDGAEVQAPAKSSADDAAQIGEPQIASDAAESLGTMAESIRETTVETLAGDSEMPSFLGISMLEWILGIGALIIVLLVRQAALMALRRFLQPVVERTETKYDDRILGALKRAISWLVVIIAFFLAFTFIPLPDFWQANVMRVINTFMVAALGFLIYRVIEIFLHFLTHDEDGDKKSALDRQFFPLLRDVAKFILILLVVIAIVQGWGYSATGILAGVGIGGLALAFAAQDTVANIFGSFVIYSDRPYKVGDWIKIGEVEGTVEEIGVRSTRIRKFDKTLVLLPNKTVANDHVQNFSEMPIRRIKVYVGLSYDASTEQITAVVESTRAMLAEHPDIDQTFWMVNFTEMSASSLDMLVYCFTETTVWKEYMDIRQDVLLRIINICKRHGVEIAFPSQTIYYKSADMPDEFARESGGGLPDELARPPHIAAARRMAKPQQAKSEQVAEFDAGEGEGEDGE